MAAPTEATANDDSEEDLLPAFMMLFCCYCKEGTSMILVVSLLDLHFMFLLERRGRDLEEGQSDGGRPRTHSNQLHGWINDFPTTFASVMIR